MTRRQIAPISDAAWAPVAKRDRRYDGAFVYAAVTTGLYCRPSCPARHPHRRNTMFFPTAEDAERKGFTPCGRCSPGSHALSLAEKCVKAVIEYLEAHFREKITLQTLSTITGLCPNHLQETFKRIVGLSPKDLRDGRRLKHFKKLLRSGETIGAAIYDAGYQSSRAVYERFGGIMGMTPATYQHGSAELTVRYSMMDATLGRLLLAGTERGICSILVGDDDKLLAGRMQREFSKAVFVSEEITPAPWITAARSCECEDPLISKLPRASRKLVFEVKMWKALR